MFLQNQFWIWLLPLQNCMEQFNLIYIYRPQQSCEGYVFTRVCHSVHGGEVSASVHAGILPPPEDQAPPSRDQTPTQDQAPPPWEQAPPWSRHPREQTPPPPRRLLLRTVCILLECILVGQVILRFQSRKAHGPKPIQINFCGLNILDSWKVDKTTAIVSASV